MAEIERDLGFSSVIFSNNETVKLTDSDFYDLQRVKLIKNF